MPVGRVLARVLLKGVGEKLERGVGGSVRTFRFKARICEVVGFRTSFADFKLGFLEVGFFGGLFAGGGAHLGLDAEMWFRAGCRSYYADSCV